MGRRKDNPSYLAQLLLSLTESEKNSLRVLLSQSEAVRLDQVTEALQVLLYAMEEADMTEEGLVSLMEARYAERTLSGLSGKMIRRVQDALLVPDVLEEEDTQVHAWLTLRRQLLQLRVVWQKGITLKLHANLNMLEKKARMLEIYPLLLEILQMKQEYLLLREGPDAWQTMEHEIRYVRELSEAVRTARFEQYCVMLESGGVWGRDELSRLLARLDKVDLLLTAFPDSDTLYYHAGVIRLEVQVRQKNWEQAIEVGNALLRRMQTSEHAEARKRLAYIRLQLAGMELQAGRPYACLLQLEYAEPLLPQYGVNRNAALELSVQAHFRMNNLPAAQQHLEALLARDTVEALPGQWERWHAWMAQIHLAARNPQACMQVVQGISLSKDAGQPMNVMIRILPVLCAVHDKDHDRTHQLLDSLRKHVNRIKKEAGNRCRPALIHEILTRLLKNRFDAVQTRESCDEALISLRESTRLNQEIPMIELLPFEVWFSRLIHPDPGSMRETA